MSDGFEMFPAGCVYRSIPNDGRNWQRLSFRRFLWSSGPFSCTTSSIVNISMFSIPLLSKMHSTILSAEMFCKVKANFSNYQIFRENFCFFWNRPAFQPLFCVPFGLCRGVVLKSECKITTLPRNHQTFCKEFFNEFYNILLNALYLSKLHTLTNS